jgi:hypothetical protein
MAEDETTEVEQTEQDGGGGATGGGSGTRTAMKAAAAAAATGAAAMAVRKALSSSNGKSKNGSSGGESGERSQKGGKSGSLLTSVASGGWEAARDAVLPLAEDAAGAAGTYLAQNGPDVVRDKIVPRFISSFNEARERD